MTLCVYLTRLIEPPQPQINHFQGLPLQSVQVTNDSPKPPLNKVPEQPNKLPIDIALEKPQNKDMQELQLLSS